MFAVPVVTTTPGGDPIVDLGEALFSPGSVVPLPGGSGRVRRDISRIDAAKSFPDNVLIDVDYALAGVNGGSTLGLSFSFRRLPSLSDGYKPRPADDRVGYFHTARQDWTTKYDQREFTERLVNRWDLKKKDPTLDLSPPEKPITFVIDKGIPYQWRRYVTEGALEWNKAFEKVGIIGAIVVQQQSDDPDNKFSDADPADARYNFIQWTVRNKPLGYGPSRADPRTGQILDADIVVDDAWIRYYNRNTATFTAQSTATLFGPETARFLDRHPQFLPPGMGTPEAASAELIRDAAEPAPALRPSRGLAQCHFAAELQGQMALAQGLAAQAKLAGLPKLGDDIIGRALKLVVMHEVGHTLGLRHNFKASSWLPMDQIRARRDAGEPFVASVMDYAPLAFFADDDLSRLKTFGSDRLGPYDFWAIEYGYAQPADGESQAKLLKRITDQSARRENAFATDEDVVGLVSPDPLAARFDLSSDPLAWAKSQIALTDKLLATLPQWAAGPEEPNYFLRETFLQLMYERSRNLAYVGRLVGGQYFSRARRGDPGAPAPLTYVPAATQREAIDFINRTVFSADFYRTPADLLNRLVPARWDDAGDAFTQPVARIDFPYNAFVQKQYAATLLALCSPATLQRVYDAEMKTNAADHLSAAELIRGVRDSVWSELSAKPTTRPTDSAPLIAAERRGLQDTHLQLLLATADYGPDLDISPDLLNQVRYALRELRQRIDGRLKAGETGLDFATRAHLTEAASRIDRTLDRPMLERSAPRVPLLGPTARE